MNPKLFRVIVMVSDVERATRFYGKVLGMAGERISPGRHYFDCDGTILACFDPRGDGDAVSPRPNPEHVYFAVDDLEATYAAVREAGGRLSEDDSHGHMGRIATRPWGERSFYADDPFGNPICFVDRQTMFTGG